MTTHSVKRILAAMDNSQENSALFKEALALASSMRAQVIVVSVTPEYEGNMNRFFLKDADQLLQGPFQKVLADAEEYAASLGLQMETIHRTGKPVDEIIAVANEQNVDLILLGCKKRMQMGRMLLGRIIVEIIINGPCDVLLMRKDGEIRFDRLLVGIDGSPASAEAGRRAYEVATSYGSEVHALYVTDIPLDRSLRYGVTEEAEIKGWKVLKDFVDDGEKLDVPVISAIRGNVVEECLVAYAKENDIHLIVLGSQSDAIGFDMFFGSIVERVASTSPCPVLVAKKRLD